jgi:hypothetical protein
LDEVPLSKPKDDDVYSSTNTLDECSMTSSIRKTFSKSDLNKKLKNENESKQINNEEAELKKPSVFKSQPFKKNKCQSKIQINDEINFDNFPLQKSKEINQTEEIKTKDFENKIDSTTK